MKKTTPYVGLILILSLMPFVAAQTPAATSAHSACSHGPAYYRRGSQKYPVPGS